MGKRKVFFCAKKGLALSLAAVTMATAPFGEVTFAQNQTDAAVAAVSEDSSSGVLSDKERGVIFADSRTDFRDESIYFVMVTRYYNGDESNDVQCWDGTQYNLNDPAWRGDFKGLIEKLDYIKALGFTAIWITPVVENCSGYDYHGYHAKDFSEIDERYESDDCTYQDLIDACHEKGMKIIQDVVLNHTGNFGEDNLLPMFEKEGDLSSTDCLKPVEGLDLPDNYDELIPDLQYDARLALMKNTDGENHDVNNIYHHYGNFNWDDYTCQIAQIDGDCVDLNTENPLVYNYLVDAYTQYIDMGVDGFRVDTVRHISRLTFNKVFNDAFKQAGAENGKDFFMFGEVCTRDNGNVWYRKSPSMSTPFYTWKDSVDYEWSDTDWEVNYNSAIQNTLDNATADSIAKQPTSNNAFLNGNNYHKTDYSMFSGMSVIDFPMHWSFKSAQSAFSVALNGDKYYNDATWNVTYVDSHDYAPDQAPENQRFNQDQSTWAENLSLMFTFRGIPCIYYGSETEFQKGATIDKGPHMALADSGRAYYGDNIEGTITSTDFGVYGNVSGAVAETLKHPLSQHIQRLNRIRQAIPALRKGQYSTEGVSGSLAFKRRYTDETTDSFVCVSISGDATFTGIPNGRYVDAVTGDVKDVTNGTLNVSVSGKGNLKAYVLDTAKTPAPGRVVTNGLYLTDGGAIKDIEPVSVDIIEPTDITLNSEKVSVLEAETVQVKATVAPSNATDKTVKWSSSDKSIATVSGGNITGVAPGVATITATTSNGLTATVEVNVSVNPDIIKPTGVSLSSDALKITEGKTENLTATVAPEEATDKTVTWASSNTSVATVNSNGVVTAVAEGTATITVTTFNGFTATAKVTVVAKEIPYIENGVYFEKPSGWGSTIYAYMWDDSTKQEYMGSWPGTAISDLGNDIYGFSYKTDNENMKIIFNDGSNQTADLEFVNCGYYNAKGFVKTVGQLTEKGTVNVEYVDEAGNVISTKKLTGEIGAAYTTTASTFDGYTLKTTPENASGTFTAEAITVTYIYTVNVSNPYTLEDGVYFEKPSGWGPTIYAYMWDDSNKNQYLGSWPGTPISDLGDELYGFSYDTDNENMMIIFNDGNNQTADLDFVNDGLYNVNGFVKTVEQNTDNGKVYVKYMDEDGNVISSEKLTGKIGTEYTTTADTFDGYTLKTTPDNANGTFTKEDITVTYVYTKNVTSPYTLENGVYFEKPSGWGSTIYVYMWDKSNNKEYQGAWPGTAISDLGDSLYGLSYNTDNKNMMIIFNDGGNQTADLEFVNSGLYNGSGFVKTVK